LFEDFLQGTEEVRKYVVTDNSFCRAMNEKSSWPENVQEKFACPCGSGISDVSDGSKETTNGIYVYEEGLKLNSGAFETNFEYY
jgi:hypothetical protein